MPCSDTRESQDAHSLHLAEQRNNVLADLLCQAGKAFVNGEPIPKDVVQWWMSHAAYDRQRGKPWKKEQPKEQP